MTRCWDCSADITVTEVTGPDGQRFVTVHDADLAALCYRAEQGYTLRTITGHACSSPGNHYE